MAPDLPSLSEQPDFKNVNVLCGSACLRRRKLIRRSSNACTSDAPALKEPDVRAKLADTGLRLVGNTPSEFAAFLAQEIEKFAAIVKAANIKAE